MWKVSLYTIKKVYQRLTKEEREGIVNLWIENRALSLEKIGKRLKEVFLIALNQEQEIIAVNSIYYIRSRLDGKFYYFYRCFIHPKERKSILLLTNLLQITYQEAKELTPEAEGLALILENPKFYRPGVKKGLLRMDFKLLGVRPDGKEVWVRAF